MNPERPVHLEEVSLPFNPKSPGAPAKTTAAKRPGRPLSKTMTVRSTLAMAAAYLVAKFVEVPVEVTDAILVIGIAVIAISLRRALAWQDREMLRLLEELEEARSGQRMRLSELPRKPKPLYRSMTVICALLMVGVYFVARLYYGVPEGVTQAIILVGVTAIAIYIRRAMIEIWDED